MIAASIFQARSVLRDISLFSEASKGLTSFVHLTYLRPACCVQNVFVVWQTKMKHFYIDIKLIGESIINDMLNFCIIRLI